MFENRKDRDVSNALVMCPACQQLGVAKSYKLEQFTYGRGVDEVVLSASVPHFECSHCGFSFTDEEAEGIRHAAVCRHLGVLTPAEIRALREQLGMSRSAFAEFSRIGEASIARWESGALIQSQALDRYMRLLRNDEVLRLARQMNERISQPHFRCLKPSHAIQHHASQFRLRKTG